MKNGVSPAHLVSDVVVGLEGGLTDETKGANETELSNSAGTTEPETDLCFSETPTGVAAFDSPTSASESHDTQLASTVDKEWFTYLLSTSVLQREPLSSPVREGDS